MADLGKWSGVAALATFGLLGCATTSSGASETAKDASARWQASFDACEAVRFDEPSWAQRRVRCGPLLQTGERPEPVPAHVWRQALAKCREASHAAACLPLGYLLHSEPERTREKAAFTSSMQRLDERMWRTASAAGCAADDPCTEVVEYIELFGDGARHLEEALLLSQANFPRSR